MATLVSCRDHSGFFSMTGKTFSFGLITTTRRLDGKFRTRNKTTGHSLIAL